MSAPGGLPTPRLDLAFPTENLRPATYNPRQIAPDALEMLQWSITKVGFVKPIIVTNDSLIIAGHQRTKAARALGRTEVPAFIIERPNLDAEIMFNQLHNGTDFDDIDQPVYIPERHDGVEEFEMVPPDQVIGNLRASGASIRKSIAELISAYGNWGGAVASPDGLVFSSPQYVLACKALGIPARVWRIREERVADAREAFSRVYGKFSYDHLEKETYIQSFAQPFRLRGKAGEKGHRFDGAICRMYDLMILPRLERRHRFLDFGAGQCDFAKALRSVGYDVTPMEFFHRRGNDINTRAVNRMIDRLCAQLETNGRFPVGTSNYVLNSVDTMDAHHAVLSCLSGLLAPGALAFFSGRTREAAELTMNQSTRSTGAPSGIEFFDENGFTGHVKYQKFFYQKFHRIDELAPLAERYFGHPGKISASPSLKDWRIVTIKRIEQPAEVMEAALWAEFEELPWPGGRKVGRGEEVLNAWRKAVALESEPDWVRPDFEAYAAAGFPKNVRWDRSDPEGSGFLLADGEAAPEDAEGA